MQLEEMTNLGESENGSSSSEDVFVNTEQLPEMILRGAEAGLQALRTSDAQSIFLEARGGSLLFLADSNAKGIACRAQGFHQEAVEDESSQPTPVAGDVYVSESQVLFVASDDHGNYHDFAIGATCIHLHAMMEDPEVAVYLQLTDDGRDEESLEVTLTPLDPENCQTLFDALCKLVSLHPIPEADDDGNGMDGLFGGGGGDVMMSDELVWAPSVGFGSVGGVHDDEEHELGGATEEERAAMLERLDDLLVVRPEFEFQEGQFEDAEDDS